MIPHLHSLMQRKSRRGRIDLPAGRVLTLRHLKGSASLCRGPCQTTHLADCQHHQKALSPSSIELREGINLVIISSPPSSTRGGLFNSSIIASDTLLLRQTRERRPWNKGGIIHYQISQNTNQQQFVYSTSTKKSWPWKRCTSAHPLQLHPRCG